MSGQVAEISQKYLVKEAESEVPAGYKKSELGIIPEDWDVKPLGEISEVRMCKRILAAQTQEVGEVPFFKIGTFGEEPDAYIPHRLYMEFKRKYSYPQKGDILLSAAGTLGKTVIYDGSPAYYQDSNIVWLEINERRLLNEYLYHYYKVIRWASSEGSTIARLYNGIIRSSLIRLPPIPEQTCIANALSDVDALIAELEKLIAKKQAIKTATMQQLLTGRTRLPQFALRPDGSKKSYKQTELGEIPEDWKLEPFSNLAKPSSARVNPRFHKDGEFCVELEHISQSGGVLVGSTVTTPNSSIKNVFAPGDVLFGKLRSYLRKYWLANADGVCSTEIWVFKAERRTACPEFIFYQVQTNRFIDASSEAYGTHMPRADWNIVKGLLIATPSLQEQTAITTILSDMDDEIQALESRLSKTRQIKQGMMQELLTGKTRLVKPQVQGSDE